jgi:hypothetical protein
MSADGFQLDVWFDDKLRAVPVPGGLKARLRRIPRLASGGVVNGAPPLTARHPTTRVPSDQALDAALVAVTLPSGLVDRLQTGGHRTVRGDRRRDRIERTAVAAVLLLAVGGSYAASLAAFLWASYPAARLATAADRPHLFQGMFSSSEDLEGLAVRFDIADVDSPAAPRVFNKVVASTEAAHSWEMGAAHDLAESEPLMLASGDVNVALGEHLDRLWRQGHGPNGSRLLLSHVGPSETDGRFDAMNKSLARWLTGRWAEWPGFKEFVGFWERLCEPADRWNELEE